MEKYAEYIIKRKKTSKDLMTKVIAVLAYILIPLTFVALGYLINFYFIMIAFFVLIGGIYILWYVFSSLKVEYEYSVVDGTFNVAKIIAKRKRKRIVTFEVSKIEDLIVYDNRDFDTRVYSHVFDTTGETSVGKSYAATIMTEKYGKSVLLFTPNEKVLEAMKPHLSRQIVVNLFYKR